MKYTLMKSQLNDAELVRKIRSGSDGGAEAELARRMDPRIRLYRLRHLRDEHASDDLTQQVPMATLQAPCRRIGCRSYA